VRFILGLQRVTNSNGPFKGAVSVLCVHALRSSFGFSSACYGTDIVTNRDGGNPCFFTPFQNLMLDEI
jgi:hypothetical protein